MNYVLNMPKSPGRPCPGKGPRRGKCPNLISGSQRCCPECLPHDKHYKRHYERSRGTSAERGYDRQWRKVRAIKLSLNPLCERCFKKDLIVEATMVHHIKPISKYPELRLVLDNLESMCNPCHEEEEKEGRWGGSKG